MVRLIVYNIEYCEGLNGSLLQYLNFYRIFRAKKKLNEKIANDLKKLDPDILALVEIDMGSLRNYHHDDGEYFKKKLKMHSMVETVKYKNKGITKPFFKIPILNKQANALLCKSIMHDIKYHYFTKGFKKVIIEAKINAPKSITLFLVHLSLGKKTRNIQLNELSEIINKTKGDKIVVGDFNTFKGKKELELFLKNTFLNCNCLKKDENYSTQPAFKPTKQLDFILTSKNIMVSNYQVCKFPYSDHLPVLVDFEIK